MTRGRRWIFLAAVISFALLAALLWRFAPAIRQQFRQDAKLVDDFNDGTETNLIGGEPFTQALGGAKISAALPRVETPGPGEMARALTVALPIGSSAAWSTGLNDLDISAATGLEWWVKTDHAPPPELRVELRDAFGASAQSRPVRLRRTPGWQGVRISVRQFPGVNFNQLDRVVIWLSAPQEPFDGTVSLDDLRFTGPAPLFVRSLQDNLYGFPHRAVVNAKRLLRLQPEPMLRAIAADTWGYFRDLVDARHHLPLNYVQTSPTLLIGDYASTTDISVYLMSVVSAYDLNLLDYPSAMARVRATLEQLAKLPTWNHFFYNYYSTTNLQVTNRYISSVDNGWLAVALVVVRQAFPELASLADSLLTPMDFQVFYDPSNGQIRLGYEADKERFAPYHYGLLATEARIISVVAIGKGDLPEDHWFRIYRTLPKEWTWQRQAPKGDYKSYLGHDVFQGYYVYDDGVREIPFVPSWGGSLFEFLMPTLVVDEQQLAPYGLGLNDRHAVEIHMDYARERGFPVWGLSPCATPANRHGGYSEFGVAALGARGYKDEAIVTPHVSMLALPFAPADAVKNIRQFLRRYSSYGPYGLYDSVDVASGAVAFRYLALDQGMSLIAINNFLNDGAIQRRFSRDPVMRRVQPLLEVEQFFENTTVSTARTQ